MKQSSRVLLLASSAFLLGGLRALSGIINLCVIMFLV